MVKGTQGRWQALLIALGQLCSNRGFWLCVGTSVLGSHLAVDCCLSPKSTLLCPDWCCWDWDSADYMSLLSAVFPVGSCKGGPSRPGEGRKGSFFLFCLLFISGPTQQWFSSSSWFQPVASVNSPRTVLWHLLWGPAPAREHRLLMSEPSFAVLHLWAQ